MDRALSLTVENHSVPPCPEMGRFRQLINSGCLSEQELAASLKRAADSGTAPEDVLIQEGIARHLVLESVAAFYGVPFLEFNETINLKPHILRMLDLQHLRKALWFPVRLIGKRAVVAAHAPSDQGILREVQKTLQVDRVDFILALPSDIIRFIEHYQDVNPGFSASAGRTPLARVRTHLARHRTRLAWYRTSLAKGRTGLAFIRTGFAFVSIALALLRIFGMGYLSVLEALMILAGIAMTADGLVWYWPIRKLWKKPILLTPTKPGYGTTFLEMTGPEHCPTCLRVGPVKGAGRLRRKWNRLTPMMRRRFLAIDRTDLAEERTILAHYRTIMAQTRTGLALTRTGVTFVGVGIAMLKQFPAGIMTVFDCTILALGCFMTFEGFHWYFAGKHASRSSLRLIRKAERKKSIWDFMFPPKQKMPASGEHPSSFLMDNSLAPGIWGTTGLALERTLIAERRNVKARLRTIMSRARTGLTFIRTGTSIFAIGLGLLLYLGTSSPPAAVLNAALVIMGLVFVADGFYWYIPAERMRKQFPYCFNDMEIALPDYGTPGIYWKKSIFSHDDL